MSTGSWDDQLTAAVRVLTAWCGEEAGSGRDIVINGNGSATLPSAKVQSPALQFHGWLHWKIICTANIASASGGNEAIIGFRLLDNAAAITGVPTPALLISAPTGGVGNILLEVDLIPLGSHEGDNMFLMRQTLTVVNAGETENSVQRYYQIITTLDQRTDHQLGFSVSTLNNGTGSWTNLTVRSVTCLHFAPRSDS